MSLIKSTSELSRLYPGDEGLVELEKQLVQHFFLNYSKVEGRAEKKAKVIIDRIKAYRARLGLHSRSCNKNLSTSFK